MVRLFLVVIAVVFLGFLMFTLWPALPQKTCYWTQTPPDYTVCWYRSFPIDGARAACYFLGAVFSVGLLVLTDDIRDWYNRV